FFLGHFTRTQESLAKSTFARQKCQRSNVPKSSRIKENLAPGFSLQRLGEVDRKTASRLDSSSTAIVAASAIKSLSMAGGWAPDHGLWTAKNAVIFQVFQQHNCRFLRRGRGGVNRQFGAERRLIRVIDAREVFQLTGPGFLVEPFRIALLARGDRRADMNLDKGELPGRVQRAGGVPILAIRANKA